MPLRDYQLIAVDDCREAIRRAGSAVFVCATGSGKTVVAGEIARLAADKGTVTYFLVHRRELVKQARDTLVEAIPDVQVGVIAAGFPETPWAKLQVASIQTLARRSKVITPGLTIWDEAHHTRAKTWETIHATLAERQAHRFDCNSRTVGRAWTWAALCRNGNGPVHPGVGGNGQPCADAHIARSNVANSRRPQKRSQRRIPRRRPERQSNWRGGSGRGGRLYALRQGQAGDLLWHPPGS